MLNINCFYICLLSILISSNLYSKPIVLNCVDHTSAYFNYKRNDPNNNKEIKIDSSSKAKVTFIIDDDKAVLKGNADTVYLQRISVNKAMDDQIYQYIEFNGWGEAFLWKYHPLDKLKDGSTLLYQLKIYGAIARGGTAYLYVMACK